jgi:hypothetical protein
MEHEGSLLRSQELSTCTYPEPDFYLWSVWQAKPWLSHKVAPPPTANLLLSANKMTFIKVEVAISVVKLVLKLYSSCQNVVYINMMLQSIEHFLKNL